MPWLQSNTQEVRNALFTCFCLCLGYEARTYVLSKLVLQTLYYNQCAIQIILYSSKKWKDALSKTQEVRNLDLTHIWVNWARKPYSVINERCKITQKMPKYSVKGSRGEKHGTHGVLSLLGFDLVMELGPKLWVNWGCKPYSVIIERYKIFFQL